MSQTADPYAARAHARAQAAQSAEAMARIPPPPDLTWDETIAAGGYSYRFVKRGARVTIADLQGDGHVSLLLFNADRPIERLNIADTMKVQWNAYLRAGMLLLSDMGRVLMSIEADPSRRFDPFCGPSTAWSNAARYGAGDNHGPHPNARDRFLIALGKVGLGRKDVHPCLNIFKPTRIAPDGAVGLDVGPFPAGESVTLRAEMNLLIVLANCPHRLDPRPAYAATPVLVRAASGPITPQDDPIRNSAPEALRAFEQTEDYFRQ